MENTLDQNTLLIDKHWRHDRNCQLNLATSVFQGLGYGVFLLCFNLYILAVGIDINALGIILSASPFAQAIGSIPIAVLADRFGYRRTFVAIYSVTGLTMLLQAYSDSILIIGGAAFLSGLALSGDFVVRISFLATNSRPEDRAQLYSFSTFLFSLSQAIGMLIAGFLPNLFLAHSLDLALAYRYTLYIAGILTLLGVVPSLLVTEVRQVHKPATGDLFTPYYFHRLDLFTKQNSLISLFMGLTAGLIVPFMNIFFLFNLGSSREFIGIASSLTLVFTMIGMLIAPPIATRTGWVRSVTGLRLIIPPVLLIFAFTTSQYIGAGTYLVQYTLFQMSLPLSFAFAMFFASSQARSVMPAWLNIAYWFGYAVAAPITGHFIGIEDFRTPILIATVAILLGSVLNQLFFHKLEAAIPVIPRSENPITR